MARDILVIICLSLIVSQLIVVYGIEEENIDWSTTQDELRNLVGSLRKKCMAETGVDLELLNDAETGVFPEGTQLGCYLKCGLEKAGLMKKGKINYKLLGKMMPPLFKQLAMDMIDECRETGGKDECDVAFQFNQCLYNANPVAYFVL